VANVILEHVAGTSVEERIGAARAILAGMNGGV
jgi:hypothetical protein